MSYTVGEALVYAPDWPDGVEYDVTVVEVTDDRERPAFVEVLGKRGTDKPDPHAGMVWDPPARALRPATGVLW